MNSWRHYEPWKKARLPTRLEPQPTSKSNSKPNAPNYGDESKSFSNKLHHQKTFNTRTNWCCNSNVAKMNSWIIYEPYTNASCSQARTTTNKQVKLEAKEAGRESMSRCGHVACIDCLQAYATNGVEDPFHVTTQMPPSVPCHCAAKVQF
jgi:hypothetical protein